jgi:hypothetical protein
VSERLKAVAGQGVAAATAIFRAHVDRDLQAMIDRGDDAPEVGRSLLGHSEQPGGA